MSRAVTTLTLESVMRLIEQRAFQSRALRVVCGCIGGGRLDGCPGACAGRTTSSSEKLETITVTGSNIRRVDIETANPVITIDRAQIQKTGKLTLGDLVQELPAVAGAATNPQVNNGGGSGASTVSLRGLGSHAHPDADRRPARGQQRHQLDSGQHGRAHRSPEGRRVVGVRFRCDRRRGELHPAQGLPGRRVHRRLRHFRPGRRRAPGLRFTFGQTTDQGSVMAGINYNKFDAVLAGNRDVLAQRAVLSVLRFGRSRAVPAARRPAASSCRPAIVAATVRLRSVTRIAGHERHVARRLPLLSRTAATRTTTSR